MDTENKCIIAAQFPKSLAQRARVVSAIVDENFSEFIRIATAERLERLGFPVGRPLPESHDSKQAARQ